MSVIEVVLNERNSRKVEELSRQTGRAPEELVNEAVEEIAVEDQPLECSKLREWREAVSNAAGIWKDRDDIPELMVRLQKEMDRMEPLEEL